MEIYGQGLEASSQAGLVGSFVNIDYVKGKLH